ncbi:p-hydroxycinnamoyl CoA hydratase/lyase [Haloferax sp. MBLA0076]|uniref:p-hydroxycinnamoyl CoA hydratase/lyase n=1 Tax=Haloferax litoreum TaxID=2666140 RepID=A0A6A8GJJ2_9EURY|nr:MULTISPECIES: enoyl-CoA hydratase-related protein [Haloferax]KAB1190453.1 p-hydroxycinnamoyl CoA hydratase/lyase [Haloferax sp. CBA1148]MRX23428.1 p-hydroxycinnamoyl CoA hydratase/lyase [Haloferax litoreum]
MARYNTIELAVDDRDVATLTFDRPEKRNAMSPELLEEVGDALETIRGDVRALVIEGNGPSFNAGMDFEKYFTELRKKDPLLVKEANFIHGRALNRIKDFPAPTIAKVHGWALGGGYMVMAVCDIAFAATDAKFGFSEINFGIAAGGGTMWAAAHTLSRRDAMYYTMTGEPFDGVEAERMGAVNKSVPPEELDDEVDRFVEKLLEKNALALEYSKDYYDHARRMTYRESHDYELAKGEEMKYFQRQEFFTEGVGQFMEDKYKPGTGEAYEKE